MKISVLSHSNIPLIALILIFPTSSELEEWDVCIVHHPCQDKESALRHLLNNEYFPVPGAINASRESSETLMKPLRIKFVGSRLMN